MSYIARPLQNQPGSTMTIRAGAQLINDNFDLLGQTRGDVTELQGDVTELQGDVTELQGDVAGLGDMEATPETLVLRDEQGTAKFSAPTDPKHPVRLDDILQTTGTSTEFPMSQKAVTDALGQPSITGSCTTNGTTDNTVQLTDIVTTLGLEVGDVIRIQYSGYNKLHSVESITNNDLIVVNYEHAGNRGNGSLKLADQTASVTITRIAKWYNAPLGLGQAWVDVKALRAMFAPYTNSQGRSISIGLTVNNGLQNGLLSVNGVVVAGAAQTENGTLQSSLGAVVGNGSAYSIDSVASISIWSELR